MSVEQQELRDVRDKQAIYEVVLQYCRGIDRLDLELVRGAYHPDGVDHHTGFDGSVGDYLDWVAPKLARLGGTMHTVGNHLVELHGDRAISECYLTASHWGTPDAHPAFNLTTGARYVDLMERRHGTWAITERWAVREWTRSDAGRLQQPEGPGPRGSRDGHDPLSALQSRFR